ncbi:hypothetical protein CANCADRAFT_80929 [Tortispora caseinolytica NRRL Y-17796]|uniref:Transcriptional adapter 2 n=1 Tax=Tortispora caseinolytica NRRL Y-17796 TaxID=767744 RepID=A0A1E4TJV2_9ASCO|nr:hypothetical protein CANCADRAFT_80929 [Tortispora caseinolytica NRRL Y-17796]
MTVVHRKHAPVSAAQAAEPGVKFHCDVCSADCTHLVRIRCAECTDYDLCVPCFSSGAFSGKHRPWHDYTVIEQHAFPIIEEDWGADEELMLVEGSETLGLGNWQDVADHIGGRTKEEVELHYLKYYIWSDEFPIPSFKRKFDISSTEFLARKKARLDRRRKSAMPKGIGKPGASVPSCHEVQGYMPGRLEFETETENDAEIPIKDISFEPDDTEAETELKLTVLDIYNSRLTTRAEVKRTILEHGLLDFRKNMANDKKRSKEERDMLNKIKPFARLLTREDFQTFSEGILAELATRKRIAQLQEYRRNGITTLARAEKYERDKAHRLLATRNSFGASSSLSNGYSSSSSFGRYGGSISYSPLRRERAYMESRPRKQTVTPLDISNAPDVEFLSPEEQVLCSELRILPKPYIAIKETLFRELLRTGGILKKRTARELIKIDVNKTARIYEFFLEQKWLSA